MSKLILLSPGVARATKMESIDWMRRLEWKVVLVLLVKEASRQAVLRGEVCRKRASFVLV